MNEEPIEAKQDDQDLNENTEPKIVIYQKDRSTFPLYYKEIINDPTFNKLMKDALSTNNLDLLKQALSFMQQRLPKESSYGRNFQELLALVGYENNQLVWLAAAGKVGNVSSTLLQSLGMTTDFIKSPNLVLIHTHPSNIDITVQNIDSVGLHGWSSEDETII